ncbi:D-alanyl-D-alanine carboxypeptidase DacA [Morganella morganii]|uniref:serine-type D-Ala-D-Ala carboxypeptidase n=1 Tax=Morganella morganii TaxID=582 RepID=A0A9Q4CKU0_MORMO|nr:D-alanyl-D-alanine carboxypeptidase DacA [Morganella morganii]BEP22270.1 D-alanyl-D-alanine carboxypeptidase DacA [Morganella morganii subsp. sibonii]HDS6841396.1 D-alanyl-D-alanine carboxypeptidase DacA [Morganella morganii subsp. morganii]EGT3621332.1 D-alanyl-D-alanine carboxypeptidase DacA [Morganella morganii]EGT3629711.1 D-alanyl-D-alanine carboxypeptidase DacA [Morganella morganii]EGT3632815.1 D-alanyl-D-alanine carboxypeptidase DacA [Morganella morganii]
MKYATTYQHRAGRLAAFGLTLALSAAASAADVPNLNTTIPAVPDIEAESYILMDYHSGKILAEKNADIRRDPASLTKMMTSYVIGQAMNAGKFTPETMVTIGENAWATGNPVFRGSSLMFLKPGERVSVSDLSRGINLQSGNDACVAMAEFVAGDQETFVSQMNAYVSQLGLKNTHFKTVHGLDSEGQYSTARDMALIGQAMIRDVPNEYAIYKERSFTYNNITQQNRNDLLGDKSLNADGIKTGHTSGAGYNLVASATEGDMRLISVVMGTKSAKARNAESKKLLTWGFRFFETVKPMQKDNPLVSEIVWFGDKDKVQLGVENDVYITIPRGRLKDLKAGFVLTNPELHAPLAKNQVVGTINFQLDNQIIETRPLVVTEAVPEGNFFSRLIDYIRLLFHRWFG